jgi:hypothetical protein
MTPSNKKDMITATHQADAKKLAAKDHGKNASGGTSVPPEKKTGQKGSNDRNVAESKNIKKD